MSSRGRTVSMVFACLGLAACAPGAPITEGPGETFDRASAPLASPTRVRIVPTTEPARTLCREQINRDYCDQGAAEDAAAACLAQLPEGEVAGACGGDGAGCLRYEELDQSCTATIAIYPTPASCAAPVAENCAFYSACVESNRPCGEDGYALGYGERYCTAFKNASFSPKGHAWMTATMICLQESLVAYATPAHALDRCDALMTAAFDAHPACYTQPDRSICFLPPADVRAVLHTIGAQELFAWRTLKQIKSVIGTCLSQVGQQVVEGGSAGAGPSDVAAPGLASGEANAAREELDPAAQYAFWQELERQYARTP